VTRHRLTREAKALAAAAIPRSSPRGWPATRCRRRSTTTRAHLARPLDADTVLIGVDDFARRLIGPAAAVKAPARGEWLHQAAAHSP